MAVVDVKPMWSRINGSAQSGIYTFVLYYSVLVDSMDTLPDTVLKDSGVPQYGADWPGSALTSLPKCINTRISDRQGLLYIVEAEYGSTSLVVADTDNPLLETPRILSWETMTIDEEADVDLDGKPILNTAKTQVRGLHRERSDTIIKIQWNVAAFDNATARLYRNTINNDTFLGNAPGTVKCNRIDCGQKQTRNSIAYYQISGEFQEMQWPQWFTVDSNYMAWDWHFLSTGTKQLDANGKPTPIKLIDGSEASEPQCLDANGAWVQDPAANPATVKQLHRKRYPRKNFAPLGLSTAI